MLEQDAESWKQREQTRSSEIFFFFLHSKLAPSNVHPLARLHLLHLSTVDLNRVVSAQPRSVYSRLGVGLTVDLHLAVSAHQCHQLETLVFWCMSLRGSLSQTISVRFYQFDVNLDISGISVEEVPPLLWPMGTSLGVFLIAS